MFTERTRTRIATAAVICGLAAIAVYSWEGWDGRRPPVTGPRVVATAAGNGGGTWTVVQVHETDPDEDCLYLRQDGVSQARACSPSSVLLDYEIEVLRLPGATSPVFFGVLPATAARAAVAAPGTLLNDRSDPAGSIPLQVRTFGETGRFVIQPAPAGPDWSSTSRAGVLVYDAAGRPILPRSPR